VNACDTCLRVKASNRATVGSLSLLETPNARGERININCLTKLPMSKSGNDTIVTIIDAITKRVRWFATNEAKLSAEKFAQLFLDHYVRAHAIPTAIVTDRDVCFQSTFWEAFTKTLGTNSKFSIAFHPLMDGLAQKANDTIQTFLRAYATADLNDWDAYLSLAEFTYNATRDKVACVAPFEGDLGYIPRLPIDFLIDPEHAHHQGALEAGEFVRQIDSHLQIVWERLEEAQD
jgi:hypothetical protein